MNKLIFLGTIVISLTSSCSNSSQSDNTDKTLSTIDSNKTIKYNNKVTQKIIPSLWVETKDAKAVADYYLSIFKEGKLKEHRKYKNPPEAGGGDFETSIIEINGMEFNILAAGPFFKFNESVSFVINCKDQAEVDYY
jgi:hypothetical protein